jgi:hypothetical protein
MPSDLPAIVDLHGNSFLLQQQHHDPRRRAVDRGAMPDQASDPRSGSPSAGSGADWHDVQSRPVAECRAGEYSFDASNTVVAYNKIDRLFDVR